jgi:hypothetical protein
MAKGVERKTAFADGERSGPVTLVEALERLLPHCGDNPHKVAEWLNLHCRTGDIPLHVEGIEIAPAATQNGMIVIVGRISPSGEKSLEGQVSGSGGWDPRWIKAREELVFTFGREGFEVHLPGPAKSPGGHPTEFSREDLFAEALVYAGASLPRTMTGEGSLHEKLKLRIGPRCPEESQFKKFFGPIYQRIKDEPRR